MTDIKLPTAGQRPWPIETEGWTVEQVFKYLVDCGRKPEEAINQINTLGPELPFYLVRSGNAQWPEKASPAARWRLNQGRVELANQRTTTIELEFRAMPSDVEKMWPRPTTRLSTRRGRTDKFNWDEVVGEFIRRIYVDDFQIKEKNNYKAIAKDLLGWCGENWIDDIPSERSMRDKVASWIKPTEGSLAKM